MVMFLERRKAAYLAFVEKQAWRLYRPYLGKAKTLRRSASPVMRPEPQFSCRRVTRRFSMNRGFLSLWFGEMVGAHNSQALAQPTPANELVRAFYDRIWNAGDLSALPDLLSPGFVFRGSLGNELEGWNAFSNYVRSVRGALAEYRCEILECVSEADRVFAKMRFSGLH